MSSLLEIEVNDPALDDARITRAELSLDGSRARIWFALASSVSDPEAGKARAAFERAAGFLRSRLSDALPIKRIPELTFRYEQVTFPLDEDELPHLEEE